MLHTVQASSPRFRFKLRAPKARRSHPRSFRPLVTDLEHRTLLSTITWANDASGDWDDPSMWSGDAVPGPSDDAVITFPDITVTHDTSASDTIDTLNCAASLDITSGSLGIDTSSPSQPGSVVSGQFDLSGASFQVLAGNVLLIGGGTTSGTITGAAGTNLGINDQDLTAGSTISSAGSVSLSSCTVAGSYSTVGDTYAVSTNFTGPVQLGSSLEATGDVTFAPASGGPVTLSTGNLTIEGGGTLAGTDSFVVNGVLTLSDYSTLGLSGTVDAYGGISIAPTNGTTIDGTTLNNHGAATWQLSPTNNDYLVLSGGAVINNLSGTTFAVSGTDAGAGYHAIANLDGSAVALFNAGTFVTSITTLTPSAIGLGIGIPFTNTGAVDVQQGSFVIAGNATTVSSGTFTSAAGTYLEVDNQILTAGSVISMAGSGALQNCTEEGSCSVAGDMNAASTTFTGPVQLGTSLEATGDVTFAPASGGPVTLSTGNLTIEGGGTLAGTDSFVVNGVLTLSDYSTLGLSGTVDAYGGISIAPTNGTTIDGTTLNNHGAATWQLSPTNNDYLVLSGGAVINNLSGATFAVSGTDAGAGYHAIANLDGSAVALFNAGTFVTSITTLTPSAIGLGIGIPFTNTGAVDVQQGSFVIAGNATTVSSGTFTSAAGTYLEVDNQILTAGSVISMAGSGALQNCTEEGSCSVAGDMNAASTAFTGPVQLGTSLEATGDVTFAPASGGPVTLSTGNLTIEGGGTLAGTDSFAVNGVLTLNAYSTLALSGTVDAYGGLYLSGAGVVISGATLNNHAAATWDLSQSGADFLENGAVINNLAEANISASGSVTGNNELIGDGSNVAFNNAGGFTCATGTTVALGLELPVFNSGTVAVAQGNLNFSNSGNSSGYTQSAGSTVLSGGTINGGSLSINGGTFSGAGTLYANVTSGGQVIPGSAGSAGVLAINGSYTQTATGALDIDIGGATAGSQYSQLAVSGTASLGGALNVALINGFQPALGNTFQPLTFASYAGDFGFYNGIVLGNRLILDPTLNPTNLTLTVQPAVTTTTLAAPPSPSVSGQSVTFTATVTVALPPTTIDPIPTGYVTFYNNGVAIGAGSLTGTSTDVATFTTSTLSTASHSITAAYTSGDTNFIPSPTSTPVTQVVNKANTSTTVASSGTPSVHGQSVIFTATVSVVSPGTTAVAYPTGTVTFYDGGTSIGSGTLSVVSGHDQATLTTSTLSTATHSITAAYSSGDGNFNASPVSPAITQVVNKDNTTTTVVASPTSANLGQTVTFTATVTANSPGSGTPTGTVDFYDTTTSTDLTPGGVALSSGTATFATTSLAAGPHTIKTTYSGDGNFVTSNGTAGTVTVGQSIIVLDPSAGGALSLSGNASINLPGGIYVDSSSSTALSASGNAQIKATVIDIHGGVQKSGNASFSPAPVTGAAVAADPYAPVAEPSTTGLTNYGSVSLSGNSSATIRQGIYSQISVSGNAKLTMSGGIYIIEGGGFSISGNASITGSGVTIFNAGSKYPSTGGTYGSITLSGNGSYTLTPPTTGTYAGIVIFQSRDNTKALTISGNAAGMTGVIYAPAAALSESGNAQLSASIDVDTLSISGNGVSNTVTLSSPTGTVAYTPAQIRAAYGVNSVAYDGTRQTIAIVDAYDDPSIDQALDAFDSQFGLTSSGPTLYSQYGQASSFLTVLNQYGQATSLPSTDPNGPGTDNWEVEEALDVEWTHAIAPGAQIILVEANSQSLSDLMASVATAACQPGVSVVSMSWGFPEGQAVFAADEAAYDSVFNVPGVTFVASTGDFGAADPEYPAFSPNVVAVGGTTLTVSADNFYNSETGWGYNSASLGTFIGSGGGISLYEPEPAYQQGVQSTGSRTTPDVSLVADPATGAWIADPYNLDPSNPFEVVGGTSLSAPAWAGLLALVNQGSAAAGGPALNSSGPTETQQALYSLPQNDYNVLSSGTNGYTAGAGYNLVTGLGTPVANRLVSDLVAYQSGTFVASGRAVAPLQSASLVNSGANGDGTIDVFSVFDSVTVTSHGLGHAADHLPGQGPSSPGGKTHPLGVTRAAHHPRVIPASAISTPLSSSIGLMALDFVLSDADTVTAVNPMAAGRQRAQAASKGSTTDVVTTASRPPSINAAPVDALLLEGLSARSTKIAHRPTQP